MNFALDKIKTKESKDYSSVERIHLMKSFVLVVLLILIPLWFFPLPPLYSLYSNPFFVLLEEKVKFRTQKEDITPTMEIGGFSIPVPEKDFEDESIDNFVDWATLEKADNLGSVLDSFRSRCKNGDPKILEEEKVKEYVESILDRELLCLTLEITSFRLSGNILSEISKTHVIGNIRNKDFQTRSIVVSSVGAAFGSEMELDFTCRGGRTVFLNNENLDFIKISEAVMQEISIGDFIYSECGDDLCKAISDYCIVITGDTN